MTEQAATHINVGGPHYSVKRSVVLHGDECTPTENELASFPEKFTPIAEPAAADVAGTDVKIGDLEDFLDGVDDAQKITAWYDDDERTTAADIYEVRLAELADDE